MLEAKYHPFQKLNPLIIFIDFGKIIYFKLLSYVFQSLITHCILSILVIFFYINYFLEKVRTLILEHTLLF